jgi:hypothetical protein
MRGGGDETAHRTHARWLRFLCSRSSAQGQLWPQEVDFLIYFATAFGVAEPVGTVTARLVLQ